MKVSITELELNSSYLDELYLPKTPSQEAIEYFLAIGLTLETLEKNYNHRLIGADRFLIRKISSSSRLANNEWGVLLLQPPHQPAIIAKLPFSNEGLFSAIVLFLLMS